MYEPFVLKLCYVFTKKILKETGGGKKQSCDWRLR